MMYHTRPDVIDRAAGLEPETPGFALRSSRPEFFEGAEACRKSVLYPADDLGLSPALRLAIALRSVRHGACTGLTAEYEQEIAATKLSPDEQSLANGRDPSSLAGALGPIARHCDRIAREPGRASAEHLDELQRAGLSVPQVVALSELLAFIGFQIRAVAGLRLLGADR